MAVADPHPIPPPAAPVVARRPRRRPGVAAPHLAVVVVNFCQWKNTARLVGQLGRSVAVRGGAAEVVVVDNCSPADRAARRLARTPGVSVVQNAANEGFARAVNRGTRAGRGDWILLLNPDVTVPPGFLDKVLAAAQAWPTADPRVGVVGFRLRNRDGTPQASAGPFPTLGRTLAGLAAPRARRKCRHLESADRTPVEWVTGGCVLIRRDCFDAVSGLDEQFFLYYEDVDLCRRAQAAGWGVWYDPAVTVTHHFPLHARAVPPQLRLVTRHALLTYAGKHWRPWQAAALRGVVWAEAVARARTAGWASRPADAACYRNLRALVGHLGRRDGPAVARHIRRAAATLAAVAAEQDGRTC